MKSIPRSWYWLDGPLLAQKEDQRHETVRPVRQVLVEAVTLREAAVDPDGADDVVPKPGVAVAVSVAGVCGHHARFVFVCVCVCLCFVLCLS